MFKLSHLRVCIAIFYAIFIAQNIMVAVYDTSLSSPILTASYRILIDLLQTNVAYDVLAIIALLLLAYSSATLWFAYPSGRFTFSLFIVSEIGIQYFTPIVAFSGKTSIFNSFYFLILGFIFAAIYISPLNLEFSSAKPFKTFSVIGLFILFLLLSIVPGAIITALFSSV